MTLSFTRLLGAGLALCLLAGCTDSTIIGGADGPTAIIVQNQPLPSPSSDESSQSEPPESQSESSESQSAPPPESPPAVSSSTPVSKAEPKAEPKPASSKASQPQGEAEFSIDTDTVKAGRYFTLTGTNLPDDAEVTVTSTASGSRSFYLDGDGGGQALIAVSRNMSLGDYQLTVQYDGQSYDFPFSIVDGGFASEAFQMDESVQNSTVNSSTAQEEYNRITAQVMAVPTATPALPDFGSFQMPIATTKISSSYGFTRIVNGKVSGRHEGVDFPAPRGTQVVAAGGGTVLYSGLMQMTGNTVVIEHGAGLKTWYQHLDSLDCQKGDQLAAGDPVGKVGTTGYSTGNHLHFGMSVFDTYTDPFQLVPRPQA